METLEAGCRGVTPDSGLRPMGESEEGGVVGESVGVAESNRAQ